MQPVSPVASCQAFHSLIDLCCATLLNEANYAISLQLLIVTKTSVHISVRLLLNNQFKAIPFIICAYCGVQIVKRQDNGPRRHCNTE